MLYYSGRKDFQVKIHGYRIELQDIECNIMDLEGILDCVALPIEKSKRGIVGVAVFILTDSIIVNNIEETKKIREYLADKLPDYMIPQKYIFLNELPITNNGKVDREALMKLL